MKAEVCRRLHAGKGRATTAMFVDPFRLCTLLPHPTPKYTEMLIRPGHIHTSLRKEQTLRSDTQLPYRKMVTEDNMLIRWKEVAETYSTAEWAKLTARKQAHAVAV